MIDESPDVAPDPAHDDSTGSDLTDEGGPLPEGRPEDPEEISLAEAVHPEDR